MTNKIHAISYEEITAIAKTACAEGRLSWVGFNKDENDKYTVPVLSESTCALIRAVITSIQSEEKTEVARLNDLINRAKAESELVEVKGRTMIAVPYWFMKA